MDKKVFRGLVITHISLLICCSALICINIYQEQKIDELIERSHVHKHDYSYIYASAFPVE